MMYKIEEITNKILQGDALQELKKIPSESIDTLITSPPYWGLRDYGSSVETIWDGDKDCEHEWETGKAAGDPRIKKRSESRAGWERPSREEFANRDVEKVCPVCKKEFQGKPNQKFCSIKCLNTLSNEERTNIPQTSNFCSKCGAWKGQLGLEPTFSDEVIELSNYKKTIIHKGYISHLTDIFNEVKRVLKKDGTCFVNIGDSYNNSGWANKNKIDSKLYSKVQGNHSGRGGQRGYPNNCLSLIPNRFAIKMVDNGWILRNTIIWHKISCMPQSCKKRFTQDFEYLFFFVKNKDYYFKTQYEPYSNATIQDRRFAPGTRKNYYYNEKTEWDVNNLKIKPQKGGFKQGNIQGRIKRCVWRINPKPLKEKHFATYPEKLIESPIDAGCPEGGIILDPFGGAMTTALAALKLGRRFICIELNPNYIEIGKKRIAPYLEQTKIEGFIRKSHINIHRDDLNIAKKNHIKNKKN